MSLGIKCIERGDAETRRKKQLPFFRMSILLTSFFLLFSTNSFADLIFTDNCKKAYSEIFQLRFNSANNLIAVEEKTNPDNKICGYLKHYLLFYKTFISEEANDFIALKKSRAKLLADIEDENKDSPFYLLCKAEVEITTAFIKFKNKEYISGAVELRKGYKMLEENKKKFPSFKPNLKSLGIIHAFIGAVPENYSWLLKIAGMSGTIKQGISELGDFYYSSALTNSPYHFMNTESHFVFIFAKQYLEKNEKELAELYEKVNAAEGPLQLFAKMSYHYYRFNGDKVFQILDERKKLKNEFSLHYLDYMEGLARLNKIDTMCIPFFYRYINNFKGTGFIKAAYQKIAWIYLIKGNRKAYEKTIAYCLTKGNDFTDEDKQALKEAQQKIVPNVSLLKSRLLFDGGFFKEALLQLSGKPIAAFPSHKEKLEFTYRLARIYDKLKNNEKAISYYKSTINSGEQSEFYFAANAALHSGQIFENLKDTTNAVVFYKRALKMRNHEYQNSIDQKAKAGLNRLGKNLSK